MKYHSYEVQSSSRCVICSVDVGRVDVVKAAQAVLDGRLKLECLLCSDFPCLRTIDHETFRILLGRPRHSYNSKS
ncbi:hypothetical protein K491DRAFT_109732 [Lophiostoma macrostomum CBS 122681]|uniref:Uncharacterized protein n=1 Tax=Lophiostoma macrostomum CBS 122681 TaxID=1314788 RepID=A0A6A6TLB1_9PLEO|nr:hypothetical protein K491DRAFT_109732 [Lophiostoma macrostomum CBS 122681]